MRTLLLPAAVVLAMVVSRADRCPAGPMELAAETRDEQGKTHSQSVTVDPAKTAVVVIDMWDSHWCRTHAARGAAMIPRMNRTLASARRLGIQVVFGPSDVVDFYKDAPQRKAVQSIPRHAEPARIEFSPPPPPGPADHCECGPGQPCPKRIAWTRQHPDLIIAPQDLIVDCNNARELLDVCQDRRIDTLLYMGAASNICVLHRQCGIVNMKRHGLRTFVVRDLVRAITANGIGPDEKPDPNFTPAKGTALVERHIERYVCPTIESRQILAAAGDDPRAGDARPRLVIAISEPEYRTAETLPPFVKKYLDKDFHIDFVQGDPSTNRLPGLDVLDDADVLLLSVKRQALPAEQMDHFERFIRAGKPLVVFRAAVTPFQAKAVPGHVTWDRFDREVLGCNYQMYNKNSRKTGCDVWIEPAAREHPILRAVEPSFHSPSWLYRQRPLGPATTVLLTGRWSKEDPDEPVAWTNCYDGGRVFYTTLGHPDDFKIEAFNHLLAGAVRWAAGLDSQAAGH